MLYQRLKKSKLIATVLVAAISISLIGCGQTASTSNKSNETAEVSELAQAGSTVDVENETNSTKDTNDIVDITDEDTPLAAPTVSGAVRDNTPVCYTPVASGVTVYSNSLAAIDASNTSEGYIMANYKGTNPKVKLQITGSNGVTYTYTLHGGYETFPLSAGNGTYKVAVYENVSGNQYATALSETINANITNTYGPYLYPNQYVNFNSSSQVVAKAKELAAGCSDDLEVITNIYNYATTITYDYNKANTVQSGYTANVDAIMQCGTGICLDYAAVMASMLRSQNIPTRLEVGYAGTAYHAWISTYINEIGWVNGIISFDGKSWSLMDPTFGANSDKETLKNFIGDGTNYSTKYIY
jgi:transglutaminase-like putative cysteine protease